MIKKALNARSIVDEHGCHQKCLAAPFVNTINQNTKIWNPALLESEIQYLDIQYLQYLHNVRFRGSQQRGIQVPRMTCKTLGDYLTQEGIKLLPCLM